MAKTGEPTNWSFLTIKVPTYWVTIVTNADRKAFALICFSAQWMFVFSKLFVSDCSPVGI